MNFANVKGITIPEGAVKALSIGGIKVWSAVTVDKYSWEAVFASIDAGTYATDYALGDCIPLDLGSEGVINMQIAAFDADDLADGSGKAKISWVAKELLTTGHRMNPSLVTNDDGTYQEGTDAIGGWEKCEMRTYLKNTIKPLISATVTSRIATVTKTHPASDTVGNTFTQTTQDDVWLPSVDEVKGSTSLYYPLFQNTDANRLKYKVGTTSASTWWLRSAQNASLIQCVYSDGSIFTSSAFVNQGVAIGFCTN